MKYRIKIILLSLFFLLSFGINSALATYGVQTKTTHCIANQVLPDPACSSGAILTTDVKTICKVGYTKTVRDVPLSERKQVFKEYDIPYSLSSNYEVDHIISLELGGSNDIANLYPEAYLIKNGSRVKDVFENYLHKQVCDGKLSITEAQREISTDWLKYDNIRKGVKNTVTASTTAATASPSLSKPADLTTPMVKKSTAGLCHQQGTRYYNTTKIFTPYQSLQACLNSGGKLPK